MDSNSELDILFCLLEATSGPGGQRGRQMLLRYLEQPSINAWDRVHAFVLARKPFINLASAVEAVDPNFEWPHSLPTTDGRTVWQWRRPPTREALVDALKYAAYRWK